MREISLLLGNYLAHLGVAFGMVGMQISLWLHFFGYGPSPQIWISVLNYWALRRRNIEAIAMAYLLVFVIAPSTNMRLNILFPVVLTLLAMILLMKNRVLWAGLSHFTISTAFSAFAMPLVVLFWSRLIEPTPITDFHFFSWILSPFLTALASILIYPFLSWVDRITQKEAPRESETSLL